MSARLSAERLQLERDLYRECLQLPKASDPAPLLNLTLSLLRRLVDADCGYIELTDATAEQGLKWTSDEGVDEPQREQIRQRVSRGIVAAAIADDEVVHTHSALLDERFGSRASVRDNRLGEVLCVPLVAEGVIGVVYLENRARAPHFSPDDVACAQTVAGFAATVAGRLLELLDRRARTDPAAHLRAALGAHDIIGRSTTLAEFLQRLATIAPMESNVLLTGGPGSGKSMFARLLHRNSRRASGPFVELNCAALPEDLIESELFGAERGAHSAVAQRGLPGKVAAAESGTLFLDEVAETAPHVQAKLLQLVQHKTFMRLGGTEQIQADVRIVSATNIDVDAARSEGRLRRDFFDRLSSVRLSVPSLADRQQDIPLLARSFCREICETEGFEPMSLSAQALASLEFSDWPGNVRELHNACKNAVVNARLDRTTTIDVHHFFGDRADSEDSDASFQAARAAFERSFLANALRQRDWNVARTARDLAMSRSHLNALIRKHEIER